MRHAARLPRSIVVAAMFVIAETDVGAEDDPPPLAITAYNYAAIPAGMLRDSRDNVIRIYREIGVDLQWTDSPLDGAKPGNDASSNRPNMFTLRLLIQEKRNGVAVDEGMVLGRAVRTSDNGGMLWLFHDQVVRVARTYGQRPGDILALAITHEIGHLLLPSPAHSPIGIMRASWDGDDIRHFVVGTLRFTPAQAAAIRARVTAAFRGPSDAAARPAALSRETTSSPRVASTSPIARRSTASAVSMRYPVAQSTRY